MEPMAPQARNQSPYARRPASQVAPVKKEQPYDDARQGLIHRVFESQVRLTPDFCAVDEGDRRLTYLELNENANKVARSLADLGVGPEKLIGICLPRSIALITGLIGILKAGGAYVPLDPALSKEQLAFMIKDANVSIIVSNKNSLGQLIRTNARVLCLDSDGSPKTVDGSPAVEAPLDDRARHMGPENLAYVNFTSGTTGVPKGVCIPHRGVIRLVKRTNYARFSSEEVFLHLSSISFDASTFEIWGCLLNGGRLAIFPGNLPFVNELGRILQSKGVTTLWLTSGFFNRVVELNLSGLRGLRQLLIGGEALSVPHVQKALDALDGCQLINGYGPTENTTFTCCYQIHSPIPEDSVPIGQPIPDTYVRILAPDGQPVPVGEVGELYIGGRGLARGYLNRAELTARKFVRDPFSSCADARLFKSGDRVRQMIDGNLQFKGRMDRQIKLRGFRIELDGVEAVLRRCRGIQEAAVDLSGKAGSQRLVAYVVLKPGHSFVIREFRRRLKSLPYYEVPNAFIPLSKLPLTENGKTDYAALPLMASRDRPHKCDIGNTKLTPTQEALKDLWQEALELRGIGIDEDFFELGGDSLRMVSLQALIERRFNKSLCFSDCPNARTIRKMANLLNKTTESNYHSTAGVARLRHAQHGEQVPLFLASGAAGDELQCYLHLASEFPEGQAIYGLPSPTAAKDLETIESIAAHHVRTLHKAQPSGPYFLGGFCFGGLVAFEMARQLTAQAEEVQFLGIIDYPMNILDARRFRWAPRDLWKWTRNLANTVSDLWKVPPDDIKRRILRWMARGRYYCVERFNFRDPGAAGNLAHFRLLSGVGELREDLAGRVEIEYKALNNYRPVPYPGPVTLFRPRRLPVFQPYDETLGWKRFVKGRLEVCVVPGPGFHGSMLSNTNAPALAKLVSVFLKMAQEKPLLQGHDATLD